MQDKFFYIIKPEQRDIIINVLDRSHLPDSTLFTRPPEDIDNPWRLNRRFTNNEFDGGDNIIRISQSLVSEKWYKSMPGNIPFIKGGILVWNAVILQYIFVQWTLRHAHKDRNIELCYKVFERYDTTEYLVFDSFRVL